jgi:flagellar biogenesis protein FliO
MKKLSILAIFSILTFPLTAIAGGVKVKSVDFSQVGKKGKVTINLEDRLPETPELTLKKGIVQVEIPGTYVWPKIEKKVTTAGNDFDTTLTAYQFDKNTVRFRAMVPYNLQGKENQVNVTLREKAIELNFPVPGVAAAKTTKKVKPAISAAAYDESYLDKLVKEKTQAAPAAKTETKTIAATGNNGAKKPANGLFAKKDEVNMTLSGAKKDNAENKSSFSVAGYIGKFVAFLGLVLLFFYGVMHLMRRGVLKKGKLGFLNDTNIVEVLNTTYLGPKKSLLMVKVHKQVFLLSSTDKGIEFLSELSDTTGLFKSQETKVAGDNFDSNLGAAAKQDKKFKLKELGKAIESTQKAQENDNESLEGFLAKTEDETTDKVKLSDQIKNKVKNLKQLQ